MSSITTNTKIVWVPLLFDEDDHLINEGNEHDAKEGALYEGIERAKAYISNTGSYCYAEIRHRVVPIYK